MATDGGLWALIRDHIPGDYQRVEVGAVGSGVPDLNFCIGGVEGWAELKVTDTYHVEFRAEQPGWISRRTRAGGRVLVVTRRRHLGGPRKGPPCDEIWVHPGSAAVAVHRGGLLAAPPLLVDRASGPRHWDWDAVRAALVGPL